VVLGKDVGNERVEARVTAAPRDHEQRRPLPAHLIVDRVVLRLDYARMHDSSRFFGPTAHRRISRSANSTMALRSTTARFPPRIPSKFAVPSANGAPACQPFTLSRFAVEASTSGTLWRRSTWPLPSKSTPYLM